MSKSKRISKKHSRKSVRISNPPQTSVFLNTNADSLVWREIMKKQALKVKRLKERSRRSVQIDNPIQLLVEVVKRLPMLDTKMFVAVRDKTYIDKAYVNHVCGVQVVGGQLQILVRRLKLVRL